MEKQDDESLNLPTSKSRSRNSQQQWNESLKKYVTATIVIIGVAMMAAILTSQVYFAISSGLLSRIVSEQFAATFCVPIAFVSALILVLILRISAGPVEFKFWGFEFRGASGPLVFWILCFLAIVWAFKMMWVWKP